MFAVALAGVVLGAGLWGCGGNDAASFVASAKAYLAKADHRAAIIELKNAIQKAPENGEARYLLAKSLLETGDPVGAEAEMRKAIALNADRDQATPLLGLAMVQQGEFAKAAKELATVKLGTPAARSDLAVVLASAHFAQGNAAAGKAALDTALVEQPDNPRARLMQAQIAGQGGDLRAARDHVETVLRSAPDDVNALLMKSQLDIAEGKRGEAQGVLEHAVAKHPDSIAARFALLSLAVTSGKIDIAKAQLEKLKQLQPRDLRTVYGDALVAYATTDFRRARDTVQSVLAVAPNHIPSLLLSGIVNLQLGSNAAAEDALRKVLVRVPDNPLAVRALGTLYLRTGRAQQALEMFEPALRRSPDDAELLRAVGEAYLASGNPAQAASSYERANAIDKGNLQGAVRLAQVRLAAGETDRAFSDLESLSSTSDGKEYQADLALFSEYLKRRQYDQALETVDRLEKKQPKSPLPSNLRGVANLAKRDLKNARASFEKALQIDPAFFSAAYNLAVIDMQEGNPKAARARYESILAKNPKNEQVLLALAELIAITGGSPAEVKAALDKAIAANPTSVRARLAAISYSMRVKDARGAVALAQAGLTAIPSDPQITEALGVSQIAAGEANQAVETFKRLSLALPQNPLVLLRLADAQVAMKDYQGAIDSQHKALAIKPDLDRVWGSLAKTYLASGRPEAAIAEARKLQKQKADKALGYAIEGEVLASQGKHPEAVAAFRNGFNRQPSSLLAARLYMALHRVGKADEASALAAKWIRDHPKEVALRQLMAEQSQRRNDDAAAINGYQQVLSINPDSVIALNNLAWLLAKTNDPKALEYAEHAHRIAPFNPSVLDTLGYVLTKSGQASRGVPLLRMAATLAPERGEIRLHFAQALASAGDKAEARKQLSELVKAEKASPVRSEAEKLLSTL